MIIVALVALLVAVLAGRFATLLFAVRPHSRPGQGTPAFARLRPDRWRHGGRSKEPGEVEVATWCEQVASALRGGDSLTRAVTATDAAWIGAPVVPTVGHAVRRGRGLAEALDEVPADPTTPSGLAVAVLRSCARVGGPASSAVDRVAETLQSRAAERAERQAASAQARLSARVLTIVPFAVLALLSASDPSVRAALVSPGGLGCVGAGAGLNLMGWWWMRRLIGRTT